MENNEEILKQLNSENPEIRKEVTEKIKNEGDLSIIPSLLDYLSSINDHHDITTIVNLLADIKDNGFISLLMNRIKNTQQPACKSLFLRICWESSLDFSDYAEEFVKILKDDDFIVALEAATILENLNHINQEKKTQLLKEIKTIDTTDEKQFLVDNILATWTMEETEE
ncbi:hypothetical protein [Odoribacter lunatus]|uniref:hypothetical protein n=1 Tax=Odoribacter lunatus TaxID=2941335 RepID=UPI00203AC26D|nr:hypothetical protein [Odoribacter lunatus]